MKKIVLLLLIFFLTGCVNINKLNTDKLVDTVVNSEISLTNQYRTGYKYYLPRGYGIVDDKEYNEHITDGINDYYLYIDIVSYYNKVKNDFEINKNAYYSKKIRYKDCFGYLEIKTYNEKYLVEIMYNYAKIEVMVDERDLNETIFNALIILSSIQYNDEIINNMMGEDVLNFNEVEVNIFETKKTESNYLQWKEEYGEYEEPEDIPDTDFIN